MTKLATLHKRWAKEPEYRDAYDRLTGEFRLAGQLIEARIRSGLSQQELAEMMGTSQSAIARLESGNVTPSMRTLKRFAEATNCEIQINFRHLTKNSVNAVTA